MILAIETSQKNSSLSISNDGREIAFRCFKKGEPMSQDLLSGIRALITEAGKDLRDVSLIAVSNGPGSLTGMRVGISTGLGLALALGVKCIGISILEAMREFVGHNKVVSIVPAGRSQSFWQYFEAVKGGSINLVDNMEIPNLFSEHQIEVFIVEDGLSDFLQETVAENQLVKAPSNLAGLLAMKAAKMTREDNFPVVSPLYIRNEGFKKTA